MKYSSFNIRALPGNGILRILFLFLLYGAFSCKSRQAAVTVIPTDSVVSNAVAGDKIGVESPAPPQDTSTAELQETYWKLTELMGKSIGPTPADKKEMNIGDSKVVIPYFSGNSFRFDTTKKNITLLFKLEEGNFSTTSTIEITNIVYEPLSNYQLGDLSLENIPQKPNETLQTATSRDKKEFFIALSPIISDGNNFKRITSFNYFIYWKIHNHFPSRK